MSVHTVGLNKGMSKSALATSSVSFKMSNRSSDEIQLSRPNGAPLFGDLVHFVKMS